jgi:zinc resistance-associated protein
MKKSIIAVAMVVAVGLGFSAISAFAWNCGGPGGCYGRGYGKTGAAVEYNEADYQKFMEQTADVRKSIVGDRAELNALMAGENPDPKRVRELTESMVTSQEKLAEMARAANIDAPIARGFGPGNCAGAGRGCNEGNCAGPGPGYRR